MFRNASPPLALAAGRKQAKPLEFDCVFFRAYTHSDRLRVVQRNPKGPAPISGGGLGQLRAAAGFCSAMKTQIWNSPSRNLWGTRITDAFKKPSRV